MNERGQESALNFQLTNYRKYGMMIVSAEDFAAEVIHSPQIGETGMRE